METPDYLPILQIIRSAGHAHDLLKLIAQRLNDSGIKTMVLEGAETGRLHDEQKLSVLGSTYDLIMTEETGNISTGTLFLGDGSQPDGEPGASAIVCRDTGEIDRCLAHITTWLAECQIREPVLGCILIGGKSSRMGRPKHLITDDRGRTWLERTVGRLSPHVDSVILSGRAEVPVELAAVVRVHDLDGVPGPMSGIGAVMREYPLCSFIVVACDMPDISADSITWLLSQREPGRAAVVPRSSVTGGREPLFAYYGFRSSVLLKECIDTGDFRLHAISRFDSVYQPEIPELLRGAWRNVNYPDDLL